MNAFKNTLNNFAMIPYSIAGVFRDGNRPYDISIKNSKSSIVSPFEKRILIVASDTHQKIKKN